MDSRSPLQDQFCKYRTFHEPVTRYVAVRMRERDRDAIDDLVQDAFTDALAELPHALLDVRGWFIIAAAKACTRHEWSRRHYTRAAYTLREHASRGPADLLRIEAEPRPPRVTFVHAMARLTTDQRRAIQLRYLDGYPPTSPPGSWTAASTPSGAWNAGPSGGCRPHCAARPTPSRR